MSSATIKTDRQSRPQIAPPEINMGKELLVVSLVFGVAAWIFFTGLGNFPLFNPDECFYAEPAREMLETGDWITTTLNYAVRYTKPPLHYWATAICYYLFGTNEFAARFFSATCGSILVATTYCMLKKFVGMRAGLIGAAILLTAPLFVVTGRLGLGDMTLSACIAGGLFCFFSAFREKRISFAFIGYALLACAAMTKGPVGIVLPVIILAAYHLIRRNLKEAFLFYKPHWGALLAAAIALPWYVVETIVTKGEYFTCFIVMENFQRFTNVVSGHKGAWWYHIAAVTGGSLPWSIFLPQALYNTFKPGAPDAVPASTSPVKKSKWSVLDTYRNLDAKQDLALFAACFALITVIFFSASVSKLLSYTVPAFPALAILLAIEVDRAINDAKLKRLLVPIAILATVYGVGILVEPMIVKLIRRAPENIGAIVGGYITAEFIALAAAVGLITLGRRTWGFAVLATATIGIAAFYGYKGASAFADKTERGLPVIARFAAASNEPIFVYKARLPSLPFYTHRATVLSPTQERPIAGTNRYTGVAGQSQPPRINFFGLYKTAEPPVTPETTKQETSEEGVQANGKPKYDYITGGEVMDEIAKREKGYVITKATDAGNFEGRTGFKKVTQAGSFVLYRWMRPGADRAEVQKVSSSSTASPNAANAWELEAFDQMRNWKPTKAAR